MAISDKTRKILWARSGNRCAICRQRLVVDETALDSDAVVGDECHIHSGAVGGPRYDTTLDPGDVDGLGNLLLLCRTHHRMVDDQHETYSAAVLASIRAGHEKWVEAKFAESPSVPPIRLRRIRNEIPTALVLAESGQDLFNLASTCHGSYQSHPDDLEGQEIELVGGFLQSLKDWTDIAGDLEPLDCVRAASSITEELQELRAHGFAVFVARERQQLTGGVEPPSDFLFLHVSVVRRAGPEPPTSRHSSSEV